MCVGWGVESGHAATFDPSPQQLLELFVPTDFTSSTPRRLNLSRYIIIPHLVDEQCSATDPEENVQTVEFI